jgi:hypothetical protein
MESFANGWHAGSWGALARGTKPHEALSRLLVAPAGWQRLGSSARRNMQVEAERESRPARGLLKTDPA